MKEKQSWKSCIYIYYVKDMSFILNNENAQIKLKLSQNIGKNYGRKFRIISE